MSKAMKPKIVPRVIPRMALELRPEWLLLLPLPIGATSLLVAELSDIVSDANESSVAVAEAVEVAKVDEESEVKDSVSVDAVETVLVELVLVLVLVELVAVEVSAERIFWSSPTILVASNQEFSFISKKARGSSWLPPTNTTLPFES
jgi:hypothetical protein